MPKWADYLISGVHYTQNGSKQYISKVYVHYDKVENIGPVFTLTRNEIIERIDNSKTIKTIYRNDGHWDQGEVVHKVKINKNFYLRTDSNNKEEDNLENLPQF